jgi:glycosyltransferase involved in cell wall biosynthesis
MINSFRSQNIFWEALDELCSESEDFNQRLIIQIVGTYDKRIYRELTLYRTLASKLTFSGYIDHCEVKHKYAHSGCLLVLQNRTKNAKGHIPGKVFEYLASGKPILALADPNSDLGRIISDCRAGKTCNFDDKESIKNSVLSIFNQKIPSPDMQKIEAYSRKNLTKDLTEVIGKTIAHSSYRLKTKPVTDKKKVLIITYYWPPSGGGGVQRWVKFAKYLTRLGLEPYILTVNPKYATYPQIDESLLEDVSESITIFHTKSIELYSLYKRISSNKEVPYGGFANTKKLNFKEKLLRFIRGNLFLPDPRRGWNRYAYKKAREIIHEYNINTVVTTSPPHSTQLIGLKLKRKLGIKWIADFRDPWTDIYYYKEMYPTRLATWINLNFEKQIFDNSDKLITVSDELKRLFSRKLKNIEHKIEIIPNGFDPDDFSSLKKINQPTDLFYISYVGTISKEYNIEGLIDGIIQLPNKIKSKLRLRFIGKITSELIDKMNESGLGRMVETIGYVKHEIAINYMFSSNILLLIIPNVKNNKGILTGKLFEYLGSNRPILFVGPVNGDAAKIIRNTSSGFICDYYDSDKITESIIQLFNINPLANHDENSKTLQYSRENLTKKLIKIIDTF